MCGVVLLCVMVSCRVCFCCALVAKWYSRDISLMCGALQVMDVAEGHLAALAYLNKGTGDSATKPSGHGKYSVFNLGTGIGYSVLDMIGE